MIVLTDRQHASARLAIAISQYCVFAQVEESDAASFAVVDKLADAIKSAGKVQIASITVE